MPQPLSWDSGLAWDNLTPGITWDGFVSTTSPNRPMASDNRISLEITAAQKTAIVDAVMALKAALNGITINLTAEEKQSLPRISDNTLAFDEKCAAYMASRADLVICAWGMHGAMGDRAAVVERMLRGCGLRLYHLGLTKSGAPRHPLYLKRSLKLNLWD